MVLEETALFLSTDAVLTRSKLIALAQIVSTVEGSAGEAFTT